MNCVLARNFQRYSGSALRRPVRNAVSYRGVLVARSHTVSFTINAPIGPMERGDLFEDPLYGWLHRNGSKVIDGGGGTMLHADGPVIADFFVELSSLKQINGAIKFVKSLGVPVGSSYRVDCKAAVPMGDCRGIQFSLQKRAGRGKAKLQALFDSVGAAVAGCGRLFHANQVENRLVFTIYSQAPDDIRAALAALTDQYSKYDPQVAPAPASSRRRRTK
jgi:hypothetical protein